MSARLASKPVTELVEITQQCALMGCWTGSAPPVGQPRPVLAAALRPARSLAAQDEDDIDALLAQFKLADKSDTAPVVIDNAPPPSARVNGSLTAYCTQVRCLLHLPFWRSITCAVSTP